MLTNEQKLAIKYQNEMINFFMFEDYKIKPQLISRDKNNHPLIFVMINENKNHKIIECYTLGFNIKQNKLMPYNIATLKISQSAKNIEVCSLSVHKAFINNNIGKILMQLLENYAYDNNIESITLESKRTYEDFSDNKYPSQQLKNLSNKELTNYLINNYYDKNLYFYQSLGYKLNGRYDILSFFTPLKKDKLKKIVLEYGFDKPLEKVNKKSLSKPIPSKSSLHPIRYALDYSFKDYFTYVKNNIQSENFAPLSIHPTQEQVKLLAQIFSTYEKNKLYGPTRRELSEYYRDFVNSYSDPVNYKVNLKYFPIENYLETVNKTISTNTVNSKSEFYKILYKKYLSNKEKPNEQDQDLEI